jgi:flavin-dependent dehydrogenase
MNIPNSADVIVIGGGPAGSLASTLLAQKGHHVVMLEKQSHPRPHVGESIIPDFWRYADLMGVTDKLVAEGFGAKGGGLISWNGEHRAHTFTDFGFSRPALHVERDRLDQILFEHATSEGVDSFENVSVTGAEFAVDETTGRESASVMVKLDSGEARTIQCRYVIDASGQAAVLGRQLGIRHIDEAFRYLSIWGYWKDAQFLDIHAKAHDHAELDEVNAVTFISSLDGAGDSGWSWHIALREETSIGVVLPLDVVKVAREKDESWDEFYERRVRSVPVLGKMLENATLRPGSVKSIRDYSHQSSALAGPGWFLAGDAAAFVDPIFSVGIVLALYGAAAASWAVDRAMSHPDQVERVRSMFSQQLTGRIEVARSLALPRYGGAGGEVNELAKQTVAFERSDVKDLMFLVADLTTRSDNWSRIVDQEAPDLSERNVRLIDEIIV